MKAGWEVRTIGEVADHCLGKMLDKNKNRGTPKPYLRNLNVRWFSFDLSDVLEMKFEDNEADRYSLRRGDVAVCEGGYPGRAAIWEDDEPIFIQKAIHRVRFHEPERARWFIYYLWYCDAAGTLKDYFSGSGIQHFTGQALAKFRLPIPPLEEQQRIVAILDEAFAGLDRARANADANLQNARELFESALGAGLARDAGGWRTAELKDLVEPDCTLSYGIVQPGEEYAGGLPIVRPTDLGEREIGLSGLKRIDPAIASGYARTSLKGREILLCVRGSTGVVAMASEELAGANVTRGIVPIRFNPKLLKQRLGYFQFLSGPVQSQIRAGTYGAALMQINIRDLRLIKMLVPPLDQQDTVLERLENLSEQIDRTVLHYQLKLQQIIDLRQSLMHKAFAGELT